MLTEYNVEVVKNKNFNENTVVLLLASECFKFVTIYGKASCANEMKVTNRIRQCRRSLSLSI